MTNLPFGTTRTSVQRDHALIAPDGHVLAPLPQWERAPGVILISPRMGAKFAQYYVQPTTDVTAAPLRAGLQRFLYVLEGSAQITGDKNVTLTESHFAYLGPGSPDQIRVRAGSRLLVIEKPYKTVPGLEAPSLLHGDPATIEGQPFMGDPDARLQTLLPDVPEMDMAVNIFNFVPGAQLPFAETHIMEHGLLMLRGGGVYRLADSWYPVQAGDTIWMAPHCPQWFGALGKSPSAYLYYKDINRDPLALEESP